MSRRQTEQLNPSQLARRVEIGGERRARTRIRLLDAAYQLFAERGADAPTIDDVIEQAGVARGTFYNHFNTRDDLFKAVADDVAASINGLILPRITGLTDYALRVSLAFRIFIHFAMADKARAWILLRTIPLVGRLNEQSKAFMHQEFSTGLENGRFTATTPEILVDLALGILIMTIHRALVEGCGDVYFTSVAKAILVAIGIDPVEAQAIATIPIDFDAFPPLETRG